MRTHRSLRLVLSAALASISALAGCSMLPTAPRPQAPTPGVYDPRFVTVRQSPGAMSAQSSGPQSGSASIDGEDGGSLTVGRFTLIVPVDAYDGDRTFTIVVPDPDVLVCDVKTSDPRAFDLPLRLVLNWAGADVVDPTALQILWRVHDTSLMWAPHPTVIDSESQVASTDLRSISDYGLVEGKAGW